MRKKILNIFSKIDRIVLLRVEVIMIMAVGMFALTAILAVSFTQRSESALRNQALSLISATGKQLQVNIDLYLREMEETSALMFSDEMYYTYDATDKSVDEYDAIQTENMIYNRIIDLAIMKNFADFCIVYKNDRSVGLISHTTENMFPDGGIYDDLVSHISDERQNDGWFFEQKGNFERIHYVKRINEKAVLTASVYTDELSGVFEYPEQIEDFVIRLVNEDDRIVYSSEEGEGGTDLPEDLKDLFARRIDQAVMDNTHLATCNYLDNGWRVICAIPAETIIKETNAIRNFTIILAAIIFLILTAICILGMFKVTDSAGDMMKNLVRKADYDKLSGVLTKTAFQEKATGVLNDTRSSDVIMFAMLDMDNFKNINDTKGHAFGDAVIARMGKLLQQRLSDDYFRGRLGGDEFAVFAKFMTEDIELMKNRVESDFTVLHQAFRQEFREEKEQLSTSLSVGVVVCKKTDNDFAAIYKMADSALYISKRSGKDQITYYEEGMEGSGS
ncbi:MAG: GGDEF domain-containing protein [Lachnospiraceae bacterium]|nr:GGDEF domain-containing protein [Lachnospiraceae bacterium]